MRIPALFLAAALTIGCGDDAPAPAVDATDAAPEAVEPAPEAADPGMAPGTDEPAAAGAPAEPVYDEMAYRIVGATAGDRACYLDLEPEAGGSVETYEADFEVCYQIEDDGLTGRLITFSMETISIMAASCEGDIDCPDRDEVDAIMAIDLVD